MQLPTWDRDMQRWDRFKAFYIGVRQCEICADDRYGQQPMVMFDTGEVVFTEFSPRPDSRGRYAPLNVEVTTSKDYRGELYTPAGDKIAIAWLYDHGQQALLVDPDTKRVVRVGDRYRYEISDAEVLQGIPRRFQTGVSAYIPGPGLPPVGSEPIVAWLPFKAAGLTPDEKAHIQMITDTARAALKLTDHAILRTYYSDGGINGGCPLDKILAAATWQDFADADLGLLYHQGVQRKQVKHDYLLTEKP